MQKVKPYPSEIRALDTTAGFIKKFWSMLQDYSTNEAAYEATERIRAIYFDGKKFNSYESFRTTISYLKRERKPPFVGNRKV